MSHSTHNFISIHVCLLFPLLVWVFMPVISFLLYLHVCCCLLLAFSPSCLSLSAFSSFDSILHRHCISSLSACCSILAQHPFHAFGLLPLCQLFFACHLCMLSPKYMPWPLHFCLSFACYFVALCLTLPLFTCEHLMAQDNF